ncbi:MAG: hypothetical protein ACREHV_15200 [Rhizomicrobium sp.]
MRTIALGVGLIAALASASAVAMDAKGNYTSLGPGSFSCGTWNGNKKYDLGRELDYGWAEGVISAYNEFVSRGKNVASDTDAEGMMGWLDNYCITHPEEPASTAMDKFIVEMKAKPQPMN